MTELTEPPRPWLLPAKEGWEGGRTSVNLSLACISGPGHEPAAPTAHLGGKGRRRQAATGSICVITLFLIKHATWSCILLYLGWSLSTNSGWHRG